MGREAEDTNRERDRGREKETETGRDREENRVKKWSPRTSVPRGSGAGPRPGHAQQLGCSICTHPTRLAQSASAPPCCWGSMGKVPGPVSTRVQSSQGPGWQARHGSSWGQGNKGHTGLGCYLALQLSVPNYRGSTGRRDRKENVVSLGWVWQRDTRTAGLGRRGRSMWQRQAWRASLPLGWGSAKQLSPTLPCWQGQAGSCPPRRLGLPECSMPSGQGTGPRAPGLLLSVLSHSEAPPQGSERHSGSMGTTWRLSYGCATD